ncbi:DUF4340 domain-containing protein [Oligoflexaceae bacterium]|nr:DUF4340 domain-containing protein [Oligoflexaceae bacterium]
MKLSKGSTLAIIGLIVVAAVLLIVDQKSGGSSDALVGKSLFQVNQLTKITAVEVSTGNDRILLKSDDKGSWGLSEDGFPADASAVKNLIESLEKVKVERLASKDKKNWDKFEVSEAKFIALTGDAWPKGYRMLLGKNRQGGGQYVGIDERVYLLSAPIGVSADSGSWALKTLLDIDPKQIKSVRLPTEGKVKQILASRSSADKDLELQTKLTQKVKDQEIKNLQNIAKSVRFKDRVDPSNELAKTALSKAKVARVELFNGATFEVKVGKIRKDKDDKYFIDIAATKEADEMEDQIKLLKSMMKLSKFEIDSSTYQKFVKPFKNIIDKS